MRTSLNGRNRAKNILKRRLREEASKQKGLEEEEAKEAEAEDRRRRNG